MTNDMVRERGWERWHGWQERIMAPVTSWVVDAIGAAPGVRVLDAACGTGLPALAIAARVRPAVVVATDVSDEMLAAAGRKAAAAGLDNLELRRMDLAALDLPDASFDAATCKDGLMYCDPVAGARELRRVLRPGGRCAVTAWDEPARNAFFTVMFETLATIVPRPPVAAGAPGPFRLARPGDLEATLAAAGFADVVVERREVVFDFDSPAMHWEVIADTAAPVAAAIAALGDDGVARLRAAFADALAPYTEAGRIRLRNTALCASARA